jgi:hypothetical protein
MQMNKARAISTAVEEAYKRWRETRVDSLAAPPAVLDDMGSQKTSQRRARS